MPDIVSPRHKQGLSGWYLPARPVLWKMIVPGVGISRSLSILAIFPVPLPSTQSWKINLTMGAVSSSITSCPVSSLIYPYGTMPPSRWPDIYGKGPGTGRHGPFTQPDAPQHPVLSTVSLAHHHVRLRPYGYRQYCTYGDSVIAAVRDGGSFAGNNNNVRLRRVAGVWPAVRLYGTETGCGGK